MSKLIIKRMGLYIFLFCIFIFLLINLSFSQFISPIYFGLMNQDKKASIEFLKKIKSKPEFNKELTKYKNIYGSDIEKEVFQEDMERKIKISKLKNILKQNNKAIEVLFGLYLLYKEEGNTTKANYYFNQAREIDPIVSIN